MTLLRGGVGTVKEPGSLRAGAGEVKDCRALLWGGAGEVKECMDI